MKKKFVAVFAAAVLSSISGCSSEISVPQEQEEFVSTSTGEPTSAEIISETLISSEEVETGEEVAFDTDTLFTGWLPEGVEQVLSETGSNRLLRQTIIDYYEIPAEYYEQTRYYYNYVDLDGDGTEEIFVVIVGSYTGGTGGNSALWCQEQEGDMQIRQAFTMVNTPVIVEEDTKDLLLQRSGGGAETEIVRLVCKDGVYTNVADAQAVERMEEMKGTAIICNNLIKDMENGSFLTLAE